MLIAIDTETTGTDVFHGCRPFLISGFDGSYNYLWKGEIDPTNREVTWAQETLNHFLTTIKKADRIIMHNANFDIRMLDAIGIDQSLIRPKLEDTMLLSHMICSGDVHGLKELAIKYLDYSDEDEKILEEGVKEQIREARKLGYDVAKHGHRHFPAIKKTGAKWWKMDYWLCPELCQRYAKHDAIRTWALFKIFIKEINKYGYVPQYKKRLELLEEAYNIQTVGRFFDQETANKKYLELEEEIQRHIRKICVLAKISYRFNIDKPAHLIDLIHHKLEIPVAFRTGGKNPRPSMTKDSLKWYLQRYNHEALKHLARAKRKAKQQRDIQALKLWVSYDDHRIHSNLNVTGTRETRQSSSAPNGQNTDKELAYLFIPPPGKVWIHADLVNIELRIWAYACGNKKLIEAFETGKSVHQMIMKLIFPEEYELYLKVKNLPFEKLEDEAKEAVKTYGRVKNGNFARIYGATDKKTNETYYGGPNAPDFCAVIDREFPEIKLFMQNIAKQCEINLRREGVFSVKTLGGYRLDVPINEPYKATNFFVQGSAGWIMMEAMLEWKKSPVYIKYNCAMNDQVHDSTDTEVSIGPHLATVLLAKRTAINRAGQRYIPTCDVSFDIKYNPCDENNPYLQKFLAEHVH